MSKMTPKTTNSIIVMFNGRKTTSPYSIRNLLEAAQNYKNRARTLGGTLVVYDCPIALIDEVAA